MIFEIESKYNVGDTVILSTQESASVLKAELRLLDYSYKILYLLEFSSEERRWIEEVRILRKAED